MESRNDGRKGFADFAGKGKSKDGVDYVVGGGELGGKVRCKRDMQVAELLGETLFRPIQSAFLVFLVCERVVNFSYLV